MCCGLCQYWWTMNRAKVLPLLLLVGVADVILVVLTLESRSHVLYNPNLMPNLQTFLGSARTELLFVLFICHAAFYWAW